MTGIREVLIESTDPAPLVTFWSELLQLPTAGDNAGRLYDDDMCLRFATTDEPKRVKNRLHLDLASTSADHQADMVRRARALGAEPVDIGQGDVPWVVLSDPGATNSACSNPATNTATSVRSRRSCSMRAIRPRKPGTGLT
ncbi:VOC family protein [Mycolicibacterium baixiangningiae]|uniref:VOC family protein n=1 Tax=Mycolicibacterium baixiangningiae TaxID=2761578 RepID=UPI001869259D|nr:VOC family protein [Mycolicibacterium baixiangningiae]